MFNIHHFSGWWFEPTPLKNMKVSWDDDIPNMMGKIFFFQTTNHFLIRCSVDFTHFIMDDIWLI